MKVIAKDNFKTNGIFYEKGDEVKDIDKDTLIKLNERGFIEPLTPKQIQNFGVEVKEEKKFKIKED